MDTWRLDEPKIQRGWSDSSTWDWAESGGGWDAEVTPIPMHETTKNIMASAFYEYHSIAVATRPIFCSSLLDITHSSSIMRDILRSFVRRTSKLAPCSIVRMYGLGRSFGCLLHVGNLSFLAVVLG